MNEPEMQKKKKKKSQAEFLEVGDACTAEF